MRISSQQIQMQLQDTKVSPKVMAELKSGSTFEGKILSIQTRAILIQLNDGSSLRAVVDQPGRFVEGQQLTFQVLENESGELPKLSLVEGKGGMSDAQIKQVFMAIDLKATTENIKAFDVLKSLDMNVSKDAIQNLTKNFQFLSKINQKLEILLELPTQSGEGQKHNTTTTENPRLLPQNALPQNVLPQNTLPQNTLSHEIQSLEKMAEMLKFDSVEHMKSADFKEVVLKVLDLESHSKTAQKMLPNTKEVVKALFGLVRNEENHLDVNKTMEKLGQLLKLNKTLTFKNFSVLDKLFTDNGKISEQVKNLISNVGLDKVSPKLLSLLKGFDPKAFESDKSVSNFFKELHTELTDLNHNSVSSRVKSGSQTLLDSINLLDKNQEDVSWLQIPIQMNKHTENIDIFLKNDKKEGNKLTKDNAKILIALNTHNLDLVQAYIQVKHAALDISFKLANDSVKQLIEQNIGKLEKFFAETFDSIQITTESKARITFSEFLEEDTTHYINLKV